MGDFRASGGYVYAKCIQDNPGGVRQSVYTMSQGSCTGQIYINQEKKYTPPSSDDLYWDMAGQPTNYTATTANNYLDLESFYSVLGGNYTNCVISANVSWITTNSQLYYNNNEIDKWCLGNAGIKVDDRGYCLLIKQETGKRIDGAVCLSILYETYRRYRTEYKALIGG